MGGLLLLLFLTFSALVANPKKTTSHGGQSRSWSAEQGEKIKNRHNGNNLLPKPTGIQIATVCRYVYMYGHHLSQSMDQSGEVANPARG